MADLISVDEARARVRKAADTLVDFESVPLLDASGRRLAQEYRADTPWPATDRSAMDGYGVRAGTAGLPAGTALTVVGVALAGHPATAAIADGEAIRIMTGAVVPGSVDAVVPVENTSGYVAEGEVVRLTAAVLAGANIRPVGSEVAMGERLLAAGQRIGAAEVGALAVLGIDPVPVFCRPRVAILATGDEVVDIDRAPAPHQVRNSNAYALAAQVRAAGGEPELLGIAADEASVLREKLTAGLAGSDVLLTIGGVSKGTHDLVHGILAELGVEPVFHGVRLKPGKPVFFGTVAGERPPRKRGLRLRRRTFVFGLPGNPASSFTVFDLLVRPLLDRIGGATAAEPEPRWARAAGTPFRANWREQAIPTALRTGEDGVLVAELGPSKSSGDPFCLLGRTGYALVPPDTAPGAGLVLQVVPYSDHR